MSRLAVAAPRDPWFLESGGCMEHVLLVVTVVGLAGLPPRPWWVLAFSWWILYTLCGLVLGGAASASRLQP